MTGTAALVTLATYDPNDVRPGWIAFWIVVALGVATFLLWRSMNRQLRKIKAPYQDDVGADELADDEAQPGPSPNDRAGDKSDSSTSDS
jgi:hypothetical protein